MVPDGSMMPFPMPPFDMICIGCTCTEYIPGCARATELEEASRERREAQRRPNREGAGRWLGARGRAATTDTHVVIVMAVVCVDAIEPSSPVQAAKAPGSVKARLAHRKYQEIGLCVTAGFP
jgi:hypothetical protein